MSERKEDQATILGLGMAAIGRPQYINIKNMPAQSFSLPAFRQKGWEMLDNAYSLGIRYFDTAPGYGLAEPLLIDWINSREHTDLEVATKWGYSYIANFDPNAWQHEIKDHSLAKLNEQWQQSRHLLPTLTTYQIHSATFNTGVMDDPAVLDGLSKLKQRHKLKIGITTTGHNQVEVLEKALAIEIDGLDLFDAFQMTYNILDQSLARCMPLLHERGKRVIIKEALANGRLIPNSAFPHYHPLYEVLKTLAKKYEVGIDAIALRFCMDSIQPYAVLSGVSETFHLTENMLSQSFEMMPGDVEVMKGFSVDPEYYWLERKKLAWN